METKTCYKCNAPKQEDANYCMKCGAQQKCKSCKGDIVSAEQNFCNQCGEPVKTIANGNSERNFVEYEKKGNSVKLKADLTDNGSRDLSFVISAAVVGGAPIRKPLFTQSAAPVQNKLAAPVSKPSGVEDIPFTEITDEGITSALERILKIDESGIIEINDQRVKHKSKRDQYIRLTLLLLFAYKLNGKEKVERSALTQAMNNIKLNDGNWRAWLGAEKKLFIPNGELVELKPAGEDEAKKYISEILDESFNQTSSSRRVGTKKKKEGGTSTPGVKAKSGRPTALVMVETLITEKYFQTKRSVSDIEKHCSQQKGYTYIRQEIQSSLTRFLRQQKIKRVENKETKKYEYYTE